IGVLLNGLFAVANSCEQILARAAIRIQTPLRVILESFEVFRRTLRKLLPLGAGQLQAQLFGNLFRDLFLDYEDIGELAIVLLSPDLAVVLHLDELDADRQTISALSHPAGEHRL